MDEINTVSDDENEITMGQLYNFSSDESTNDSMNSSLTPDKELNIRLYKETSNNNDYETVDENKFYVGYNNRGNKCGTLLIQDDNNPDYCIRYIIEKNYGNHYRYKCNCKKFSILLNNDGKEIVKTENKKHTCTKYVFRYEFFTLKKNILLYGTCDDIDKFEKATEYKSDEKDVIKVNQRDWCYVNDEKKIIIVRDEIDRTVGYEYIVHNSDNPKEIIYKCTTCNPNMPTKLYVYTSKSGIPVLFKTAKHSSACSPDTIRELGLDNGRIPNHIDMDLLRFVPKEDWELGYSSKGVKGNRLIIKEPNDKELCCEYGTQSTKNNAKKLTFYCTTCQLSPYNAYLIKNKYNNERRVVAPQLLHKCKPKLYKDVMEQQRIFSGDLTIEINTESSSNNVQQVSPSTLPFINDNEYETFGHYKYLIIYQKDDENYGYLFQLLPTSPKSYRDNRQYKCVSCSLIAIAQGGSYGRKSLRCSLTHDDNCKSELIKDIKLEIDKNNNKRKSRLSSTDGNKKRRSDNANMTTPIATADIYKNSRIVMDNLQKPRHNVSFSIESQRNVQKTPEKTKSKSSTTSKNDRAKSCEPCLEESLSRLLNDAIDAISNTSKNNLSNSKKKNSPEKSKTTTLLNQTNIDDGTTDNNEFFSTELITNFDQIENNDTIIPKIQNLVDYSDILNESILPSPPIIILENEQMDRKPIMNSYEIGLFVRPSNSWIRKCCDFLDLETTDKGYKNWAKLKSIDFTSNKFPERINIKQFTSGFSTMSYLLTGNENDGLIFRDKLNSYIFSEFGKLGVVAGNDLSKKSQKELSTMFFTQQIQNEHFDIFAKLFNCSIIIYDYNMFMPDVYNHGNDATIVIGVDNNFFLFMDEEE